MELSKILLLLDDCRIREKLLKTAQYGLLLLSPLFSTRRTEFVKISSQISLTRTILRFFDDSSALNSLFCYGFGKQNESLVERTLSVLENIAGQLYLPIEHFAFAYDFGILTGSSAKAWKFCIILWAVTLITSIMKLLFRKRYYILENTKLKNENNRKSITGKLETESLILIMYCSDLLIAMHLLSFLPHCKQLPTWKVGLLGTISSIIGLMRLLDSYRTKST